MEPFYGIWYRVSTPPGQLTGPSCGITYEDVTQCLWNRGGARTFVFFFSSPILSEITTGINYSARPGRGGNNISKSLMEMQNQTLPCAKWDDGRLESLPAAGSFSAAVPNPVPPPRPPAPVPLPLSRSPKSSRFGVCSRRGAARPGSALGGTRRHPTGPDTR